MNKQDYVGKLLVIIQMKGEPNYWGRIGRIKHVDGAGQLHGTWGSLAVVPGVDKYFILKENDDEQRKK